MSAAGGGRSFQVIIDLILRGVPQAQASLNNVVTGLRGLQTGATGAARPIQTLERNLMSAGRQTTLLDAGFGRIQSSVGAVGPLFTNAGNAVGNTGRQMTFAAGGTSAFNASLAPLRGNVVTTGAAFQVSSGQLQMLGNTAATTGTRFSPLVGAISMAGPAANTTTGSMSTLSAATTTLRENARTLIFPIGGMVGALNEAAFMSGRTADMQTKLAEANAEVNRLFELGLEGTTQYEQAVAEVDRATRALNFTQRIATQSWFDVLFFMGTLAGTFIGVIQRFNELRKSTAAGSDALHLFNTQSKGVTGVLKGMGSSIAHAIGGLGSLAGGLLGVGKNAKLAQTSLGQATQTIGLGTRVSSGFRNALVTIGSTLGLVSGGSLAATGAMKGLGAAIGKTSASATTSAARMGALSTAATGGSSALVGLGAAGGVASAALAGAIATMIVFDANIGGAKDSSESFVTTLFDLAGASDEAKTAALANMDAVSRERLAFLETLPVIGEWVASLTESNDTSEETTKAMVGVADAAGIVSVAMDGSLVPAQDLAQANLNLAATAGALLEANGLLGPGMKILGTDMTLAGDAAIYLAGAYIHTQQESMKATQEAYNLVLSHRDFNDVAKMTVPEVIALAAALEEQGKKATESGDAVEEATNSFGRMKETWATAKAELQPLVHEMGGFIANTSLAPPVIAGVVQGLAAYNEATHGAQVETAATAAQIALTIGGWAEFNRVINMTPEEMAKYVAENKHVVEGLEEATVATRERTAAQEIAIQMAEYETAAITSFSVEARSFLDSNLQIIDVLTRQAGEFDKNAVAIAATKDGMVEFRDSQIEAYAEIYRTAEALGFQGDAYAATGAELMTFIANTQQQNEVNEEGVQSYLELSQANRDYLATLGLTAAEMAAVSQGTRDLTEQESLLIQVMAGVEEANARNVEGMVELVLAGEDVNRVIGLTNEQIAAELALLEQSAEAHELTAEQVAEHAQAMSELDPMIQNVARAWNVYTAEAAFANEENQRLVNEALPALQSQLDSVRQGAIDFAIAMGTDMRTAYSMSTEELIAHINQLQNLPPEFESVAEASARAAEEHLEGWVEAYDGIREAQEEWASTMTEALDTVGEEFTKELKGIGTDSKEEFRRGIQFDDQFWNEAFPAGMARAAFDKNVDVEDIIEDTKKLIDRALDKGLITEQQAEESFYPFIEWMETNLPEDTRQAMALLNAAMPELIAEFGSTVVEGIGALDNATEAAINAGVVTPAQNAVATGFGPGGVAQSVVENLQLLIPRIEDTNPEFAAAFFNALIDPITQQERPFHDQIQRILNIFMLMGEAGKPMVAALDADLSGVPDVLEQNVVTPAEQSIMELNEQWITAAQQAAAGGTNVGTNFQSGFNSSMASFVPRTGVKSQLDLVALEGSVAGADTSQRFIENANTGFTSWNLRGQVEPKLNEIPPAAEIAGTDTGFGWARGISSMPTDTQETVDETGGKFEALHQAIDTERGLIFTSLGQITDTIWNWQVGVGEMLALMDFSGLTTAFSGLVNLIGPELGKVDTFIALWLSSVNTMIINGTGSWMVSWLNHFNSLKAQFTTQLEPTFARYYTLLTEMSTNVWTHTNLASQHWNNHALTVANAKNSIMLSIQGSILDLTSFSTNTWTHTNLASQHWNHHALAVANVKNSIMLSIQGAIADLLSFSTNTWTHTNLASQHWNHHVLAVSNAYTTNNTNIQGMIADLAAFSANTHAHTHNASLHWNSHANTVAHVKNSIKQSIDGLVQDLSHMASQTHSYTNNASQHWNHHAGQVNSAANNIAQDISAMARSGASSVNALANSVSNAMGRIISDMDNAAAAAGRLQSAINRLRSKTITVTTRYRTTGRPAGAARGFNGVVNRPQDIHVGEGGRPELVSVTPLQGTAGARHNGLTALGKTGMTTSPTTVRAAGGAGFGTGTTNIGGGNMTMASANDDVTDYRRHVEKEVDRATAAWDDYRNDVKRYLGRVNTFMSDSADKTKKFAGDVGGALGTGTGGTGTTGGGTTGGGGKDAGPGGDTFGGTGGGAPKNWLHEDTVDNWADKFGYNLKSYDPLSANKLRFMLNPESKNFKYIWEDTAADFLQRHGWRFATGGYNVSGNYKTRDHRLDMTVQKAQHGLNAKVRKPTMILAGEHGTEDVSITAAGGRRRGGGGVGGFGGIIDNRIIIDGIEMKRWIRKVSTEGYSAMR